MAKTGELGNLYGKPDVERIGLFSEMPYMNGKGYVSPFPKQQTEKGRNIMGEGPKIKTARQDCYFDKEYKRLFIGEALKGRGYKEKPSKFKNVSEQAFVPAGGPKLHSTPGDYYGCFEKIEAFSNKKRPQPKYQREGRNILSRPGKQGGPGYVDTCINFYPSHASDRYGTKPKYKQYGVILDGPMVINHHPAPYFDRNPFQDPPNVKPGPTYVRPHDKVVLPLPPGKLIPNGPGKLPGGCHAGCFDKFPEHKPDKYLTVFQVMKQKKNTGGNFFPQSTADKSFPTCSVINENIRFRLNQKNQAAFEPSFVKYLVD